ncbi:hypothetical protein GCM10008967_35250 [Bacillus carboniphilus]|uniref:Cytochrome c oxidase subunit 2A n=1 Tax=Bacillus carboniphilus TaxID=86663 RepID=A0ABP3GD05_9BACI
MGASNLNNKKSEEEKESMLGTYFSVGIVGGVILLTYVIVFGLYMIRV